jgi:hypothetical protein
MAASWLNVLDKIDATLTGRPIDGPLLPHGDVPDVQGEGLSAATRARLAAVARGSDEDSSSGSDGGGDDGDDSSNGGGEGGEVRAARGSG